MEAPRMIQMDARLVPCLPIEILPSQLAVGPRPLRRWDSDRPLGGQGNSYAWRRRPTRRGRPDTPPGRPPLARGIASLARAVARHRARAPAYTGLAECDPQAVCARNNENDEETGGGMLRTVMLSFLAVVLVTASRCGAKEAKYPPPTEGDFVVHHLTFRSGESLPDVKLHYTTLGKPIKDASGKTANAVLVLHGTGGTGHQFLAPYFAGELFNPGQLLDASRYYLVLVDGVGHGKSSKP